MTEQAGFAEMNRVAPRVVFAGNIAAGKTTLARATALDLNAALLEESVDDNPYLARFYADMPRWAMHLNMYFLASRAQQLLAAENLGTPAVLDRSFYEDRVFVDVARQLGQTSDENYRIFDLMEGVLTKTLPRPTLLVYLTAPLPTLMHRVRARDRAFEAALTTEYLTALQQRYDAWIEDYSLSPKIKIQSDGFSDRISDTVTQDVISRVRGALNDLAG